jgi:Asp-tRNA(Asn)/Glu-tRNA(Gln) amidotransferase B subunit
MSEYKLGEDDARILSADRLTSDFYEELVSTSGDPRKSCSYITTILFAIFEAHHERIDLSHVQG